MRSPRRGFTLVEVTASLVVSGFVLLVARAAFDSAREAIRSVTSAATAANDEAQRERTLRELAAQARFDDSGAFLGEPASARFATWCEVAGGWREPCLVNLIASRDSVPVLAVRGSAFNGTHVLMSGARSYSFRYLRNALNGGEWITYWPASSHVPRAIGIILPRDTVILPLGVQR